MTIIAASHAPSHAPSGNMTRISDASSEIPGGGVRSGSRNRADEPGTGPEGGSGPYLTVLSCSLDLGLNGAPRPRAPQAPLDRALREGPHEPSR